ncbi:MULTISPECIES: hypothetical protein [Bacillus]|uniref:Uncharacterized protein n=1 Tax=Bacillus glycinifermentans TaxID=1664069 RepID=A0A0T6BM57_9BACI|nr:MULTISPECIES: hypothetical protein [Bacillus]ATH91638.1 hypothetical protein COP00_02645 [Bacillus glycinifermentans]KRT92715.1 hypothetical protein AB447_222305 [Bacillus glycinifermentans]MDU0072097.1 hypothetical protein [Bacillus sp. IG6]MEC0483413.1 hypothetical protein [Bacillus glycinifermentans]MED8019644.1 hypothetical protein [Bacillus glycinifermentans]
MRVNRNPLREIIGTIQVEFSPDSISIPMEVYECGHYAPPKQDIIGEYNAVRRRCAKCGRGKPPQLTNLEIEQIKNGKRLLKIEE